MPRRNDFLFGQIALERKLVTQEQLQQALSEQAKDPRPKPLGVLRVARGFITDTRSSTSSTSAVRRSSHRRKEVSDDRRG